MDHKEIKRLVELVEDANITHLSIEQNDVKIEIKKEGAAPVVPIQIPVPAAPVSVPVASDSPAPAPANDGLIEITSQMVGTFYAGSSPDAAPFVKVGDTIQPGDIICIIEAMKLFNEIESDVSGVIEKMCVKNGDAIEFGQCLFLLKEQ